MKMLRIAFVLVVISTILACSSVNYLVNEWAIRDVKSLDESSQKIDEILEELKKHGQITFTKEQQYQFATPYGISNGRWFMMPKNIETVYTINENNDTIKNKIVKYSKENIVIESMQPGSRMLIDLVPKVKN